MEEINLEDLIGYFKRNILLIATSMLIFVLAIVIYLVFVKVPVYNASTTIILATDSSSESITTSDISLNQSLVSTYSEIIKSKRVLNQVIENLDIDITYDDLISQITVANITDTEMLEIEVTNVNASNASIIANEIASVFTVEVVEIYSIENVSIIDYAEKNDSPSNDDAVTQIMLAALVGLFLSSGIIFLFYYFDRRIKTKEEIERITGLPILGVVPISKEIE